MYTSSIMSKELESKVIEYFILDKGVYIKDPESLLYIGDCIIESNLYSVYFKNKSIKHFVERRKEDLAKRHSPEKSLEIILAMVGDLSLLLTSYTSIETNTKRTNSFLIYKAFENVNKTPVTAVLLKEDSENVLIISYYFTKKV